MRKKPSHKETRDSYGKIYGRDSTWEVFKFNLLKIFCVDLMSKAFWLMIMSGSASMFIIFWSIMIHKDPLSWTVYAILIMAPTFFGLWWIEKARAEKLIDSISDWIRNKK